MKTGSIGDVLMTTPAVRLVREAFPNAHIAYLVGRQSRAVLMGNPHIDEVIAFDENILLKRKLIKFLRLAASLRGKKFDTVIAFHGNVFMHLFSRMTGASRRVAVSRGGGRYLTDWLDLDGKEAMHPADLYVELLSAIGIAARPCPMELFVSEDETRYALRFKDMHLGGGGPVIGLFPGGGRNLAARFTHKRWGIENFNWLSRRILEDYPGSRVVVFGSSDELDLSKGFDGHPAVLDLIGRTSLRETIALMSVLDLAVTNDSCPLHFGAALGIPTVSLFGPTAHVKYAKESPLHKVLAARTWCSPCEDSNGRFVSGCGENICMASILPEAVFEACAGLLDLRPAARPAVEAAL